MLLITNYIYIISILMIISEASAQTVLQKLMHIPCLFLSILRYSRSSFANASESFWIIISHRALLQCISYRRIAQIHTHALAIRKHYSERREFNWFVSCIQFSIFLPRKSNSISQNIIIIEAFAENHPELLRESVFSIQANQLSCFIFEYIVLTNLKFCAQFPVRVNQFIVFTNVCYLKCSQLFIICDLSAV